MMEIRTEPIENDDAKIAWSCAKPSIRLMFCVVTDPVTSFVTPRFTPMSTKNEPRVIRKLAIPVFMTRYPLRKPTESAKSRDRPAPTHRLMPNS